MDREERIAWLVDHQRRPRHRGSLPDPAVTVTGGNAECGDEVTVQVRVAQDGARIEAMAFTASGCTLSQAAASILAERVNRERPLLEEVERRPSEELLDLIGRDITMHRPRCATLALGVLQAAARRLLQDRRLVAAGYTVTEVASLRRAAGVE